MSLFVISKFLREKFRKFNEVKYTYLTWLTMRNSSSCSAEGDLALAWHWHGIDVCWGFIGVLLQAGSHPMLFFFPGFVLLY